MHVAHHTHTQIIIIVGVVIAIIFCVFFSQPYRVVILLEQFLWEYEITSDKDKELKFICNVQHQIEAINQKSKNLQPTSKPVLEPRSHDLPFQKHQRHQRLWPK